MHRIVGHGGFAGILQQRFHQRFVPLEFDALLDVVAIGELMLIGGLRQNDDVGKIGDEIVAFLLGTHFRHRRADILFGQGKIALPDIDAVGAGKDRVGIPSACDRRRQQCRKRSRTQQASGEGMSERHDRILWREVRD